MPIRFRCSQCDRLLGIARRKAGSRIQCPQCGESTTVPATDQGEPEPADRTLRDLDDLLGPPPVPGVAVVAAEPALMTIDASVVPKPAPVATITPPRHKPKPVAKPDSLFEQDVDALLGIAKPEEALELEEAPKAKPVSGADAMSLDDGPGSITLSSQKATLIVVAAVLLMLIAFITGFAIRATI
jgi:hypothetical protein